MTANWVDTAPCAGLSDFVHDGRTGPRGNDVLFASMYRPELRVCGTCPFRKKCIELVKPQQSKFDGVCGGRLWSNGRLIATTPSACETELEEPELRAICGTDTGWLQHIRHSEIPCSACRSAKRVFERIRRTRENDAKRTRRLVAA
ncbi:hypothetical protein [Streptomyces beijiangensis]|uniref:4Fe-4S Wbl-type domain-containing protein n=1 Tax=Streptomyces beijiangensis TaxID=163361 RepID=A0A939JMB6_9ACTN|nr:hypothetical protein [Streptomyces beijiangensis]MBO0517742.1 hypothetical protein [Streptomyces beijiangensis]